MPAMSESSSSSKNWVLILILLLVAAAVWWLMRGRSSTEEADAARGENPSLLLDRVWIDSKPEKHTDYMQAMIVLSDAPIGAFQKASAYHMELEIFESLPEGDDLARPFVTNYEGKLRRPAPLLKGAAHHLEIGPAESAGPDPQQHLTRGRVRNFHLLDGEIVPCSQDGRSHRRHGDAGWSLSGALPTRLFQTSSTAPTM